MFTMAFRSGKGTEPVDGACPIYNEEIIIHPYRQIKCKGRIGESFTEFISLTGDIAASNHVYLKLDEDSAEEISENSLAFCGLREYADLIIKDERFRSLECFMFFLELMGLSIPAFYYKMPRKEGHENDDIEESIPVKENMDFIERSLRGFLKSGHKVYDISYTVYECETIEDVCVASLHYLITKGMLIRKCKNCGKYFIAYNRSDTVYCDRPSPFRPEVTCRVDGSARTHKEKIKNSAIEK